jgi:Tol biopolymer transport system component
VAYRAETGRSNNSDIWVQDLDRGVSSRFTFHPSGHVAPGWSPDGSRIVFSSSRDGQYDLYWKNASGAGQDERLLDPAAKGRIFTDWTGAGNLMLFQEILDNRFDLWVMPMTGERKPAVFLKTEFDERNGAFSPGGQWIAYQSNESGRNEIYVQPYPATGAKWQVSREGGTWPRWRRDRREIYWLEQGGTMMAAEVSAGESFEAGTPVALFETGITNPLEHYAVTADGKRFLVPMPVEASEGVRAVTVVQNWLAGAKR